MRTDTSPIGFPEVSTATQITSGRLRACMHVCLVIPAILFSSSHTAMAAELQAGAAKVDVTSMEAGPVHDRLYVRALVLKKDDTTAVIISVDAVAIGEIGPIKNDYLGKVRDQLHQDLNIPATNVMVNASHCHGIVCTDVAERTVQAVREAAARLEPVRIAAGTGHEDRIMENRRLTMSSGEVIDVRHAYSMPPDDKVVSVGPVDPEIGLLRLERANGQPMAVVYNFACHPIQGVPGGGNTADVTGFSSAVIEDNLGDGVVALFIQGCAGDINPRFYKDVDHPRDAETFGNILGLSALKALRTLKATDDNRLTVINEAMELPRADTTERMAAMETEQERLLRSLRGTTLSLKTFLPLAVKYSLSVDYPSYYSHAYLQEGVPGRAELNYLDAENRRNMAAYVQNIQTMEQLTRVQTNLALLRRHQAQYVAAGKRTLDVELVGLRIGNFVLTTFPGELTVQIGLNLKQASPHDLTFVAGYTNGYIYYAPTTEQLLNTGGAQEDCDSLLAPEWQPLYEKKAMEILKRL